MNSETKDSNLSASRESFLERVRQAVLGGNRSGRSAPIPARGQLGYQGARSDPVTGFQQQFANAGGQCHVVDATAAAISKTLELIPRQSSSKVLLGRGPFIDSLDLRQILQSNGVEIVSSKPLDAIGRDDLFDADVAITGVDHLVAETGTMVFLARPNDPRYLSLLPPVHIAIAHSSQIIPDLFDLFEPEVLDKDLSSCVSLVTGPSKTGDIELKLVTGVHGPREVHVVLVAETQTRA
jgi:L-lactate dehydrogenase complex protein LldG